MTILIVARMVNTAKLQNVWVLLEVLPSRGLGAGMQSRSCAVAEIKHAVPRGAACCLFIFIISQHEVLSGRFSTVKVGCNNLPRESLLCRRMLS